MDYREKCGLIKKAVLILQNNLSKNEMIALGDCLDGGMEDHFLDEINKVLEKISPEVFIDNGNFVEKK